VELTGASTRAETGESADMPVEDDACRAVADEIEEHHPGWLVLWGCFSQRYVAFPLFSVRRRVIVTAYYPRALVARMDEVERVLRVRPTKGEGE
jgi:hypothetical protein